MNIEQMLQQTNAVEAISRELGVDPATAQAGAAALLPQILSGFQNPDQRQNPNLRFRALAAWADCSGRSAVWAAADCSTMSISSQPTEVDKGNQILGQIFGSKDGSRAIAAGAAAESGVEPSLLKKMLPILAMLAAGYVMKQAGQGGGLGGGLGGALGGILGGQPAGRSETGSARAGPARLGRHFGRFDRRGREISSAVEPG